MLPESMKDRSSAKSEDLSEKGAYLGVLCSPKPFFPLLSEAKKSKITLRHRWTKTGSLSSNEPITMAPSADQADAKEACCEICENLASGSESFSLIQCRDCQVSLQQQRSSFSQRSPYRRFSLTIALFPKRCTFIKSAILIMHELRHSTTRGRFSVSLASKCFVRW